MFSILPNHFCCIQQGNDNIHLLVIIYVWRAKPNVWVGLQRPKMGRFFFIHRTQLHLNKLTPSERLAPTENTRQPQTLKLNHSPKSRSHQHIVKNSLYFISIYIYRQIMHISNEKKWPVLFHRVHPSLLFPNLWKFSISG